MFQFNFRKSTCLVLIRQLLILKFHSHFQFIDVNLNGFFFRGGGHFFSSFLFQNKLDVETFLRSRAHFFPRAKKILAEVFVFPITERV